MHIVKPKHPAVKYAHDVLDGTVVSGRLLRLAVERNFHDHETGRGRGIVFDPAAADRRIRWFGLNRQYVGEFDGQPLVLEPWQQWITWVSYGWKRLDGTRRFRQRWIEVGTGNGKTTLMAADANGMLVADDEAGAEIYSVAVQKDQSRILWNAARLMIEQSPELLEIIDTFDAINNHRIVFPARNSFFVPLGRDSKSSSVEGKLPHALYFDEVHEYKDRKQVDVLLKKMQKRRQAMATFITTASDDTPETLYEELHDYAADVVEGFKGEFVDDSFFSAIYAIDKEDKPFATGVTEADFLRFAAKANPNLGVSINTSVLIDDWKKGQKIESSRNNVLRFNLNRRATTRAKEISAEEWDACADYEIDWEDFRALPSICAVDLSSTQDITGIAQLWVVDGTPFYRFRAWLPEDGLADRCKNDLAHYDQWAKHGWLTLTPGNHIDDEVIGSAIRKIDEEWNVVQWTADQWHMKFIINHLQRREPVIEVVNFLQDIKNFAEPTMHFLDELRSGKMRHDGNPLARWCATNLVTKEDSHSNRIPHKRSSKKRIDPIVAGIMTRGRAIVIDLDTYESDAWDGSIDIW